MLKEQVKTTDVARTNTKEENNLEYIYRSYSEEMFNITFLQMV